MVYSASGTRATLPGSVHNAMGGPGPILNERQLTSAIKNATNAQRLLQLACSHSGGINAIHVAAILTKLANITKAQPNQQQQGGLGQLPHGSAPAAFGGPGASSSNSQEAHEALVAQLQALLKVQRCHGHCPRGLANIIWALGKMHDAPDAELMLMLLRRFFGQLGSAVPQDIANVLWGVAQITRDHGLICPSGLQEKVAADDAAATAGSSSVQQQQQGVALEAGAAAAEEIAGEACCLSSSTTGKSAAAAGSGTGSHPHHHHQQQQQCALLPLLSVLQVQQLLRQLCGMLMQAAPQTISNITCALCVLQHCHRWCMCTCLPQVQQLVAAFTANINESLPSHIHKVVKWLTQMALACAGHAGDSWISWQPPLLQVMLTHLAMQRRTLKQFHIVSVLRDMTQLGCLFLPLEVTTEVAATSAAAAAAAVAAEAEAARQQQQQHGGAAAGSAAATAAGDSVAEEAHRRVMLALAAAAAAVDEVLDVKALEDVDDDSGLPSTSALLVAAAAAAARARAAAAAAAAAVATGATAPPATPSLSGIGAPSSSSSCSSMDSCAQPDSPATAYVRCLVADIFARLRLGGDAAESRKGAAAMVGGATADSAKGGTAAPASDDAAAAAAAARPQPQQGSSSNSSVLEKLLPQLERLGLLQQYNTLRNYANNQGLVGGHLLGRQYTYPGAGSTRPGQHSGGSGFMTSGDAVGEAQLARQQALSWQQQQQFGGMQQPPRQQRWCEGRQQQQQQQQQYGMRGDGGMYGGAGMGRRRVDVLGQVMEAGVYGSESPTAYGSGMPPGRVFVPGQHSNSQQQQQQQMLMQGGVQPPPPPPQQLHYQQQQQRQQMGPAAGLGEYMSLSEAPSGDVSMISPFQSTGTAAAAAAAASGPLSKPLGSMHSPHGNSGSVSTVPSQLMQLSSKASSSSSSSCYTQLGHMSSGLGSSVSSLQPGISGEGTSLGRSSYGLTPSGSSGDARMRLRLPGHMSAPMTHTPLGQGSYGAGAGSSVRAGGPAAFLPGPTGSGPAHIGGVGNSSAASNNQRWQMMQPQMSGSVQSSMAGSTSLSQQQQQQQGLQSRSSSTQLGLQGMHLQGGLASRGATPAGQSIAYAQTMGVLSPEASASQGSGLGRELSSFSLDEPPGLVGSGATATQLAGAAQQQQQQQAARVAEAPIVFLTANAQQVAYHRMPDGTLVPVQQQQQLVQQQQQQQQVLMTVSTNFTGVGNSPTVVQQQQQQAQMLQMLQQQQQQMLQQPQQQQQQVLVVQNSAPASMTYDVAGSSAAAAAMAEQQAGRQQVLQMLQVQQMQQPQQLETGQVMYYVPAGNAPVVDDSMGSGSSSIMLSGAGQGGYVLVDSGGASAAVLAENSAGFNMVNVQGQMLVSPQMVQQQQQHAQQQQLQQQQMQLQQQLMQQQQQQLAGMGSSTAMLQLNVGSGSLGVTGVATQDAASAQLLSTFQQQQQQQEQVFYMMPQQRYQG